METELLSPVSRVIAETAAGSPSGELVGMERADMTSMVLSGRYFPAQEVSFSQEVGAPWTPLWASARTGASHHAHWLSVL